MLTTTQQIGIIAVFAIAAFIISKLMRKDDGSYEKAYTEILTSDKHKVKGRFED